MKKFLSAIFLSMCFLWQNCNAEEIKMESIPVLEVNQVSAPKIINSTDTRYESLIEPAQENKPSLNFNLSNIKNVKKGAILPNENANKSLTEVSQYFKAPYDKVFSHLVGIVDSSELEVVSYDSASGRIFANYRHEKPIFITVSQYNSTNVLVKITPADGIYDLPPSVSSRIFGELHKSLMAK